MTHSPLPSNRAAKKEDQRGSHDPIHDPETTRQAVRDIDPNVLQRQASNPKSSVWVGASAGSGKTKVLTDRVLRILLPKSKDEPGSPVHKILCLTFTKAAASEMALRISSILAEWAALPQKSSRDDAGKTLDQELKKLLGREPADYEIEAASKLFAHVIDRPGGGLQIMTIHAFCQSLLGRFPLESQLGPGFEVMEDSDSKKLLQIARAHVLREAGHTSNIQDALGRLAAQLNDTQLDQLLTATTSEREQFQRFLGRYPSRKDLEKTLYNQYGINTKNTPDDIITKAVLLDDFQKNALRIALKHLQESSSTTDQKRGIAIQNWLDQNDAQRQENWNDYVLQFLKADGDPRQTLATKAIRDAYPDTIATLIREQTRILETQDRLKRAFCATLTLDLFEIAQAFLNRYQGLKAEQNVLDFDDLIEKTSHLLQANNQNGQNPMRSWVLYKLDQGLDHIMVDEAQDTNPEQWRILQALCEEFYAGSGMRDDQTRTLFVVGDEKQSIYSFQRASPEEFSRMRSYFAQRFQEAEQSWSPVNLNISFRSTASVLHLVDHVFNHNDMPADPGFTELEHIPFRRRHGGIAELWPVFENEQKKESRIWDPPVQVEDTQTGAQKCAGYIADKIAFWLKTGEVLDSKARAIAPGDILILVRARNKFVGRLIRALKNKDIPVSGEDRMILGDQIAIQDLCALAEFCLLPSDNLTLAALLKSPLIGLEEEELYDIAANRDDTLWQSLQDSPHQDIVAYLENTITAAVQDRPFEFFNHILQNPCPADPVSGWRAIQKRLGQDARDPVEEFLNLAIAFESRTTPNLQNFIQMQKTEAIEIKRQMEESGNAVRIMTVHGSKGLQSPIVILPDTLRSKAYTPGQIDKRLLWPEKTGLETPLFSPRRETDFDLYQETFQSLQARSDEEYRRLLYVALTRAEDRIYITGHQGKQPPLADSWYTYCARAFDAMDDIQEIEDPLLSPYGHKQIQRLYNPHMEEAKPPETKSVPDKQAPPEPDWLLKPAPVEPSPPRPFAPSRPAVQDPAILSPLENTAKRFRRGNLTHKLLQFLPELAMEKRGKAAKLYLDKYAHDLDTAIREEVLTETMKILDDPDFSDLFGPGSMAEVPITGLVGDTLISGQIDRIVITDSDIRIIDYKTNRPPPLKPDDVPEIYLDQMRSYRDAIKEIYPAHTITCLLLWTDGPHMMRLDIPA